MHRDDHVETGRRLMEHVHRFVAVEFGRSSTFMVGATGSGCAQRPHRAGAERGGGLRSAQVRKQRRRRTRQAIGSQEAGGREVQRVGEAGMGRSISLPLNVTELPVGSPTSEPR